MGVSLCEFESRSGHQKTAGRARLDSRASLEALLARRGHMEFAAFRIRTIFHALLARYGPQGWWPGGGPFETIVGAILTQNTSWRSVEQALAGLRDSGALAGPESLDRLAPEVLERLIRPAGFRRQKAATLKRLVARASREPGGLTGFLSAGDADLRRRLLEIKGIGPETADSIMLYAAGRPVFVVDAYTRRLVARHGLMSAEAPYDHVQQMFARALPPSARVMNEYHALIVRLGKTQCRPAPLCLGCPLRWDLPGGRRCGP